MDRREFLKMALGTSSGFLISSLVGMTTCPLQPKVAYFIQMKPDNICQGELTEFTDALQLLIIVEDICGFRVTIIEHELGPYMQALIFEGQKSEECWLYEINGEWQGANASEYPLSGGDIIAWYCHEKSQALIDAINGYRKTTA